MDPERIYLQHVALPAGQQPDWAAAEAVIATLDGDDIEFIGFALSLEPETCGGVVATLAAATDLLEEDLDRVRQAFAAPAQHNLHVLHTQSHTVFCAASRQWDGQPRNLYGALLRLSLMYVLDAAGLVRLPESTEAVELVTPPPPARCRRQRTRLTRRRP